MNADYTLEFHELLEPATQFIEIDQKKLVDQLVPTHKHAEDEHGNHIFVERILPKETEEVLIAKVNTADVEELTRAYRSDRITTFRFHTQIIDEYADLLYAYKRAQFAYARGAYLDFECFYVTLSYFNNFRVRALMFEPSRPEYSEKVSKKTCVIHGLMSSVMNFLDQHDESRRGCEVIFLKQLAIFLLNRDYEQILISRVAWSGRATRILESVGFRELSRQDPDYQSLINYLKPLEFSIDVWRADLRAILTPNIFIGLSGKMGAGKDTTAESFMQLLDGSSYPYLTKQVAFAANVKRIVATLTSTTFAMNNDRKLRQTKIEALDATLGELQQKIGQGLRDIIHPDVWVNAVMSDPEPIIKIVTDVRYPNEVAAIEASGGFVVRIVRDDDNVHNAVLEETRDRSHPSETALDDHDFEYVIYNDGDKATLGFKLMKIFQDFIADRDKPVSS